MKVDFEDEVIKFKEAYTNYYFKNNGKYFYVFVNDIDKWSNLKESILQKIYIVMYLKRAD